jgi:leader peptidase (prepilin peptidase)/N-methyltransferase
MLEANVLSLSDFPPWLLRLFATLFGLAWGSFLNVVIHRVPRGQSLVRPASHCPGCGAPIRGYDNIPLVSYLLLRGRSRCCKTRISPRYLAVEASGGLLALALVETTILSLDPRTSMLHVLAVFVANLALVLGLVAASFIDLEHMYIPDSITYGATAVGIATFALRPPLQLWDALLSAAGSFALIWLVFGVLYRLVRGRTGMGLGDAKLLMVAGAWFGWVGALFVLLAGAVQGTVAALVMLLFRGRLEEPEAVKREREEILASIAAIEDEQERAQALLEAERDPILEPEAEGLGQSRIAFGPFLALATIEYLLFGPQLVEGYLRWLAP